MESLEDLLAHALDVSYHRIVSRPLDLRRVDGSLQSAPVGRKRGFRLIHRRSVLLFWREPLLIVDEDHDGARHHASLPWAAVRVVVLSEPVVRLLNDVRRGYAEVEHLDWPELVHIGLQFRVVAAEHQVEQFPPPLLGYRLDLFEFVTALDGHLVRLSI